MRSVKNRYISIFSLYLHRVFSFDQQDDAFVAGGGGGGIDGDASSTATGGGESLITVSLP